MATVLNYDFSEGTGNTITDTVASIAASGIAAWGSGEIGGETANYLDGPNTGNLPTNPSAPVLTSGEWSVGAFIRRAGAGDFGIFRQPNGSGFNLRFNSSLLEVRRNLNIDIVTTFNISNLTLDEWKYITVTHGEKTGEPGTYVTECYVDGVKVTTDESANTVGLGTGIRIGGYDSGSVIQGDIGKDFRIEDARLSDQEVEDLYDSLVVSNNPAPKRVITGGEYTMQRNVNEATTFTASLISPDTGEFLDTSTVTLEAGDVQVSQDGGGFSNITTLPVVIPGNDTQFEVSLSQSEMNAGYIDVRFVDQSDPKVWQDVIFKLETIGETGQILDASSSINAGTYDGKTFVELMEALRHQGFGNIGVTDNGDGTSTVTTYKADGTTPVEAFTVDNTSGQRTV